MKAKRNSPAVNDLVIAKATSIINIVMPSAVVQYFMEYVATSIIHTRATCIKTPLISKYFT